MHPAGFEVRLLEYAVNLFALPLGKGVPRIEIDVRRLMLGRVPAGHDRVVHDLVELHIVGTTGIPVGTLDRPELDGGVDITRAHGHRRAADRLMEHRLRATGTHFLALEIIERLDREGREHGVRTLIRPAGEVKITLIRSLLDDLADTVFLAPHDLPGLLRTGRAHGKTERQHAFRHVTAVDCRPACDSVRHAADCRAESLRPAGDRPGGPDLDLHSALGGLLNGLGPRDDAAGPARVPLVEARLDHPLGHFIGRPFRHRRAEWGREGQGADAGQSRYCGSAPSTHLLSSQRAGLPLSYRHWSFAK